MNILKFELRKNLPGTLIWAISLAAFGYLCVDLFVMFHDEMKFFMQMIHALPEAYLTTFGADLATIETLTGFYSFCFMYIIMCGAFQALYMGMNLIGKELAEKSAEFLYTKPMKRWKICTYKLLCAFICIIILNIIYGSATLIAAKGTGYAFDETQFIMINSALFLTQLLFLCLGFCLGCFLKKIKSPLSLTSGIISIFFMIQMLVNLKPDGFLSNFSFLSYVSANSIVANHGFDPIKLTLLISLSILFFIGGYLVFQKRDISSL